MRGRYWVTLSSVTLGKKKLSTASIPVILDSGTTLCFLPPYLHTAIGKGVPTSQPDPNGSGFYFVNCDIADTPGTLDFVLGNATIRVAYRDLIWSVAEGNICIVGTYPSGGKHNQ